MAVGRKGSKTKSKMMIVLFGQPFSGKSTLALQTMLLKNENGEPLRVLYIDNETNSIDDYLEGMENSGANLDNIYIVYTQSLGEVRQYLSKVKNKEDFYELDEVGNETEDIVLDADGKNFRADVVIIDGVAILKMTSQQGLVNFSKKRNAVKAKQQGLVGDEKLVKIDGSGMELKDYQTLNFQGQDLVLDCVASGVHCIITAREADEKISVKTSDGKTEMVVTGKKIPDGFKGMDYNAKTVLRTFVNEDNVVCLEVVKDRTGVYKKGEIVEDPTILDFQKMIDKTAQNKNFVVKNDLTKAVEVETEIFSKELDDFSKNIKTSDTKDDEKTSDVEIIRAEIKAVVDKFDPIKKQALKTKAAELGFKNGYSKETDVETLKKIKEMVLTIN